MNLLNRIRAASLTALAAAPLIAMLVTGCETAGGGGNYAGDPGPRGTKGPAAPAQLSQSADQVRNGDKLAVVFSDVTSAALPPHDQQVREDGRITLPYIGELMAAGKTRAALEKEIHDLYVPRYFLRLTVTVKTEERLFYVGGEVRTPSRQIYSGEMTVLKAIKAAGDFTDFANRRKVRIIHANGKVEFVNALRALEDPKQDVPIYPGDQIIIPRRLF